MTCALCNGTHIVHEIDSFSYRTSCCPECGPEADEKWLERIKSLAALVKEQKEVACK